MTFKYSPKTDTNDFFCFPRKIYRILFYVYIIISFYEGYINQIIGAYSRYYIFFIIIISLFSFKKIKIDKVHWLIFFWFFLKLLSIFWGQNSLYHSGNVLNLMAAHIGMVALFITLTLVKFNEKFVLNVIKVSMYTSFSMALLGIFFSEPYLGVVSRQVLTLFGTQVDPNNLAAFYSVGFGIAVYYFVNNTSARLKYLLIIIINGYGVTMTGSRAGLITLSAMLFSSVVLHSQSKRNLISLIKKLIIIISIMFLLYYVISNFLPIETYERLFSFDAYSSGSGRDDLWGLGIKMIIQKPILGWGWGGNPVQGSHNTFITMALEIGIVGLIIFLAFIAIILKRVIVENGNNIAIIMLLSSIIPAFFIDAINKRFFWNGIIIALMVSMLSTRQKDDNNIT